MLVIFFTGSPVAKNDEEREKFSLMRQAAVLSAIPGFLVVPPVVGVLAGRWLDQRFHTAPWLLLVFLLLGFGSGVRLTLRTLKTVREMQEHDD
jgi:ATP synthase protein I